MSEPVPGEVYRDCLNGGRVTIVCLSVAADGRVTLPDETDQP